ncbi:hypothetical protein [Sphingobacterium suaedae]|uniref:Fimbrillin family protein n=1 Tax=Sphingobacterium suaedae TaxID=1686402 RepID=A0ABW5KL25_9SPHI
MLTKLYPRMSALPVLVLSMVSLFAGCAKTADSENIETKSVKLTVDVVGVEEVPAVSNNKLKTNRGSSNATPDVINSKDLISFESFDAQISLEKWSSKVKKKSNMRSESNNMQSTESEAPSMEEGITYRILFYKSDGSFVHSTQMVSGIPGEITLNRGESYDWYAVSYHNSDPMPAPDPAAPELVVPHNTDLLYASGSIEIPAQGSGEVPPLNVLFSHRYARIVLELNSMGMFGDMNQVGLEVSGVTGTTASFNLKDASLSNISSEPVNFDFEDFSNLEFGYADRKVTYIYTAREEPIDLNVSVHALDIKLSNGTNRIFSDLMASPAEFEFSLTPQIGTSYAATINFVESPLIVNSVRWARTNLYYHGGHNPYRFLPTNAHTNARNTYFSFRGMLPGQYGISLTNGDPCALVYPEGLWRTVRFNDLMMITPVFPIETYKTENGLGYYEYDDTQGTGTPYPSAKLRFNMNGFGTATGVVDGDVAIDLGSSYGRSAHVWSTFAHDVGRGMEVYSYLATFSGGDEIAYEPVNYSGTGPVESTFKNIRCVR